MRDRRPFEVLIVGGGYAALEAAFRLQRVAGSATHTTILAPDTHVAAHPMAVLTPFAAGHALRAPLGELASAAAAMLRHGRMISVDVEARRVVTDDGGAVGYDALLIATGAVQRPASPHALAFGAAGSEELMHGLIQDLEAGYLPKIAFVVPAGASWPLALYELALMTAERAYGLCQREELMFLTAEQAPLGIFGEQVSCAITARLHAAGVTLRSAVDVEIPGCGLIELHRGRERLTVDRIVTLPLVDGAFDRRTAARRTRIPRRRRARPPERRARCLCRRRRHASPDQAAGLACQQADMAADMIAARAGAAIEPQPYTPVLEGILLTERATMIMRREQDAAGNDNSVVTHAGRWRAPTKAIGRELAARLAAAAPRRADHPEGDTVV